MPHSPKSPPSVTPPEDSTIDDADRFDAFEESWASARAVTGKRGGHGGRTRFQRDAIHMQNRLRRAGY